MDRFTWGIVVGALLLVLAAVGSVAVLQARSAEPDLSTPEGVVRAYYAGLDAGRPDQVWDLLSGSARAGTTRDEFIKRATSYRPSGDARITVDSVVVDGNTAVVRLSRTYGGRGLLDGGGGSSPLTVRLDRENGAWKISVPPDPFLIERPRP